MHSALRSSLAAIRRPLLSALRPSPSSTCTPTLTLTRSLRLAVARPFSTDASADTPAEETPTDTEATDASPTATANTSTTTPSEGAARVQNLRNDLLRVQTVHSDAAPAAVGAYSQATKYNGMVYVSGCLGIHPKTGEIRGGVEAQTRQAMKNMGAVLTAAGSSYRQVVKTTILLAHIGDFPKVNAIYAEYFPKDPPARACFAVKDLPKGGLVEIEAIAASKNRRTRGGRRNNNKNKDNTKDDQQQEAASAPVTESTKVQEQE